ncbi:MAG: FliI/YscN family ATPase [Nitrospirae bacterium]|nr:FliI/YscN family ATPase [Nitrospirota bacterium]
MITIGRDEETDHRWLDGVGEKMEALLSDFSPDQEGGLVVQGVGLMIEAKGMSLGVGEICTLLSDPPVDAEVVGFREGRTLLMPLGDLEGVRPGTRLVRKSRITSVRISPHWLGRVLDPLGRPMDGRPLPPGTVEVPLRGRPLNPLLRRRIERPLDLSVRSINALATVGEGQKIGIFAGPGVGKSTLMGMMARNASVDVNVIALIGERGREVREFLERDLGPEGLSRTVLVVATGELPPLLKTRATHFAMAIAEMFRDRGQNVLFMMDSLTRYAGALREIGLATGEPPSARGFTPSVFAQLPRLVERAGCAEGPGSITGIYTVLVEGEDLPDDPLSEALTAILDGHIHLSRTLAHEGVFPAVEPMGSLSRVMADIVDEDRQSLAREWRRLYGLYRRSEDLIRIGAYVAGGDPELDRAVRLHGSMTGFLRQGREERVGLEEAFEDLARSIEDPEGAFNG